MAIKQTKVNSKLDKVSSELADMDKQKANKNGIFSMANMGQDIKVAMTGGSVAVVGENAVNTVNVIDKAITTSKRSQNGNFGYISCLSGAIEINTTSKTIKIPTSSFICYGGKQGESITPTTYSWVDNVGCFIYYDTENKNIITLISGNPNERYVLLGGISGANNRVWFNTNSFVVNGKRVDFLENNNIDTYNLKNNSVTFAKRTSIGSNAIINSLHNKVVIKVNSNKIDIIIPSGVYVTFGIDSGYNIVEGTYSLTTNIGAFIYFNQLDRTLKLLSSGFPSETDVLIGVISSNGYAHLNCNNYEVEKIGGASAINHFTVKVNYNENDYNDNGCLWLPTNYKSKGTPTRLIIFCHGSGEKIDNSVSSLPNPFQYLLKMGYAILDMNGIPTNISGDGNGRHFNAPFGLDSYTKGYHYVIDNFNIEKDVFVTGMSLGGMIANQIVQSGTIPVIATGLFCPVTDYFKQAWCKPWQLDQRKLIAKYFLLPKYDTFNFTSSGPPTNEEIQYFKDNIDKIIGYNPMIKNEMYWEDTYYQYPHNNENTDYLKLRKTYSVPIKIWHNLNDGTVLPIYSEYFIKSVKRTGGIAELKNFATGGHNAWDNGEVKTLIDINGSDFTLKESGYELIKWFERFNK